MIRWGVLWICMAALVCGCGQTGLDTTSENDFVLELEILDRTVHVGAETPMVLRLRRVDNSNLENGFAGEILVTTSGHGRVDAPVVQVAVRNETTRTFLGAVVFLAERAGIAEVRATFLDATVSGQIVVSEGGL